MHSPVRSVKNVAERGSFRMKETELHSVNYRRRKADSVWIGALPLGSDYPVRIQTMADVDTTDTISAVAQAKRVKQAGADYFRFTAQGVRQAEALAPIHEALRREGIALPLIADIHFNPQAAFEALKHVEKVRINPGNFAERKPAGERYTEAEFEAGERHVADVFGTFLAEASRLHRAIRIGVNHGSLSRRMVERYGNTPLGMVESALEYLRICKKARFTDVVVSMKSSNLIVMTQAVRLLAARLEAEGFAVPLHLGVTEAGESEDGRIKSAIGIGSLLADGIGDTIRVSLSEPPEAELPVARLLLQHVAKRISAPRLPDITYRPAQVARSEAMRISGFNTPELPFPLIVEAAHAESVSEPLAPNDRLIKPGETLPSWGDARVISLRADAMERIDTETLTNPNNIILLEAPADNAIGYWRYALATLQAKGIKAPVILHRRFETEPKEELLIAASVDFGTLLAEGAGSGIMLTAPHLDAAWVRTLGLSILQAVRLRFSHTEFISCPGCGRTLFNLQSTVAKVKAALGHLPNLKIGVMGCIVNGPGEMADADYGYVGGAPGKIDLYRGQTCLRRGINDADAVDALIALLKEEGRWHEPPLPNA